MRRVLAGVALAVVMCGCQGDRPAARVAAAPATTAGQAATTTTAVPPACTARGTTALLAGFFAAHSAGSIADLDQFFAPADRFQWYAQGIPPGLRTYDTSRDRGSLLGYLRRRHARHERITVEAVDFNGYRDSDRTGHFAMLLRRSADDIPGGPQRLGGKGAVDCDSQRLMVVGIGLPP